MSQYFSAIDRLRALAALSVLLAHVVGPELPGLSKYAFTGLPAVMAFFVISGFCINYPYVNEKLPVKAFLSARAIRIFVPAAVSWPIAYVLGMKTFNPVDGYILWSVVCEAWYYGLYPFLLYIHRRWVPFGVQWAVALVIAYSVALLHGSDQYGNMHVYGWWLNWVVGLPSWLLGCVLAERRTHFGNVTLFRVLVPVTASILYWMTMNTGIGFYITGNLFSILCFFWISSEINAGG